MSKPNITEAAVKAAGLYPQWPAALGSNHPNQ